MDDYLYLILLSRPGESEASFKDRLSAFWTHVLREHPEDFESVYAEKTSFEREGKRLTRTYLIEEKSAAKLVKHLSKMEMDFDPLDPADVYSKYEASPPDWFWIEH